MPVIETLLYCIDYFCQISDKLFTYALQGILLFITIFLSLLVKNILLN